MLSKDLELLLEARNNTLEAVINKFGYVGAEFLSIKITIGEFRDVLYSEIRKIVDKRLKEEFG